MKPAKYLRKQAWVLGAFALMASNTSSFAQIFNGNNGRIAVTADGNIHDEDDFGATPVTLAILAKRGLQNKLVHYDYNDHIGESTARGEREMNTSALGAQSRFGFNRSVFFDDIANLNGSVNNLKNAINASSAGNRLFVILAGPSEVLWRAMNAATPNKRGFVTVVSHSFFNEFHANNQHAGQPNHGQPNHTQLKKTITDVRNLGAQFIRIANQNDYWNTHLGGRGGFGALSWMQNHPNANMRWVYTRIQAVGRADYSDAGMAYYLITGNDTANTATQQQFFQGAFPNPGGNTGGGAPIGQTVAFKSSGNGQYVASDRGLDAVNWPLAANRPAVGGSWERFKIMNAGGGKISITAVGNNKFVSADMFLDSVNWRLAANRESVGGWEKFTWISNSDGTVSLRADGNNDIVAADRNLNATNWPLAANRPGVNGSWEKFTVQNQ